MYLSSPLDTRLYRREQALILLQALEESECVSPDKDAGSFPDRVEPGFATVVVGQRTNVVLAQR